MSMLVAILRRPAPPDYKSVLIYTPESSEEMCVNDLSHGSTATTKKNLA